MGSSDTSLVSQGALALDEATSLLLLPAAYVLGLAIYAVFIFRFYRLIAARDIFRFDLSRSAACRAPKMRNLFSVIGYAIRFAVLFPAFAFLWFAVLTVMMAFLAENRPLPAVLLIALVTISTVRVCAYHDEDLARDLAKILPFAVLSVYLVGKSTLDISSSVELLRQVGNGWATVSYYWAFFVVLELALRLVYGIFRFAQGVGSNRNSSPS